MFKFKYYDAIKEAQRKTRAAHQDAPGAFELNDLGADSLRRRFKLWARDRLFRIGFFLLRALRPNLKLGRLVIVSRDEDVREALKNSEAFEVPYGLEMRELGGADFVLGLEDKPHTDQRRIISSVMPPQDAARIAELSAKFAKALIQSSGGRIDVMKDFITRVSTETCIRYFGLTVHDPDAFAEWAMSVSALLFADPFGDEKTRQLALNGAARIRAVIDRSIMRQRQYLRPDDDTVLGRLLDLQASQPHITDEQICAILVGLVTGFIPTTTLAAGKILQQLLRRADTFEEAKTAALKAGDDRTKSAGRIDLRRLLFEAARLNPALDPGQWRYARATATLAAGKWRAMTVKKGSVLMVSTMSALRDSRRIRNTRTNPAATGQQWPGPDIELMFGCGIHSCLGTHIAMVQITEMFEVLLSQQQLRVRRRAFGVRSAIHWVGPFPRRFDMEFEPVSPSIQSMITICAPLEFAGTASTIRNMIKGYGNPSKQPLKTLLDHAGFVHFASLSVIDVNVKGCDEPAPFVLLELNVDGSQDRAIAKIARIARQYLSSIFQHTPAGRRGKNLEEILRQYALDLKTRPWGNIGLNYMGTRDFQVPDIEKQASLAAFTRDVLDYFLGPNLRFGNRAMQALGFVRMFIEQDKLLTTDPNPKVSALLQRGKAFSDYLTIPSRKPLAISNWKDPGKLPGYVPMAFALLKSRPGLIASAPAILFLIGIGVVLFQTSASLFPTAPFPGVWWYFQPLLAISAGGGRGRHHHRHGAWAHCLDIQDGAELSRKARRSRPSKSEIDRHRSNRFSGESGRLRSKPFHVSQPLEAGPVSQTDAGTFAVGN